MGFDLIKYTKALEHFISTMENVTSRDLTGASEAVRDLAQILSVGMIQIDYYESAQSLANGYQKSMIVFQEKDYSKDCYVREQKIIGNGSILFFTLHHSSGDTVWPQEQKDKLSYLIHLLFIYLSRNYLLDHQQYISFQDAELGIFSMDYFEAKLDELIEKKEAKDYGACFFDLRRFSAINTRFGRDKGTQIMNQYVKALERQLDEDGLVARVSGDDFVALFRKEKLDLVMQHFDGITIYLEDSAFERAFVSATAGMYMLSEEVTSAADVIDCINAAGNIARNSDRSTCVFYDEQFCEMIRNQKEVEEQFPLAIEKEEFLVYYQPKVHLGTYQLNGAEALCRWKHNGELIAPYKFIPVLEQSKNICKLDFYMLEHVCRDIKQWLEEGKKIVRISVNLSRRHLGDVHLVEHILAIIDAYSVPHQYIEIELTESTTEVDYEELKRIAKGLQDHGISTSVDDFGTGYSSLNLIRELPWNVLKIDRSFLEAVDGGDASQMKKYSMLKHVIAMTREMGIECIAEGVETPEHISMLKENNCFLAQGFYFDKPLPKDEFEIRLEGIQ